MKIPFNRAFIIGKEVKYIECAIENNHLSGNGMFTKQCQAWLEESIGCKRALLTHSCTAALEMAAILAEIVPGDEVIMPSYTFVSTANAFVLRGGIPVFVDIRPDTFNIDESKIETAITKKTKAIVPVHYAGVGCEMDIIMDIAVKNGLLIIEDAAQSIGGVYKGKALGGIGHLAALSFHETKNVTSGEGGALLVNDTAFIKRAEIVREKGTDRCQFFRGEVDKYTWHDVGSSYLPSDINAAFLKAQLEHMKEMTHRRLEIWNYYHSAFEGLEKSGDFRRPRNAGNGHMYYLLLDNEEQRERFIKYLKKSGISAVSHYVPLHDTVAGKKYCRVSGEMTVTDLFSKSIVRLPMWCGLDLLMLDYTCTHINQFFKN